MPPEYCEYGPSYEECLPWIRENMPHLLGGDALAAAVDRLDISEEKGEGEEVRRFVGKGKLCACD